MAGGGFATDYWGPAQKMLADTGFLKSLMDFDKDNVSEDIMKKIHKYVAEDDFDPEKVNKVSKAAHGLCRWVRAVQSYDDVCKVRESL